MIHPAALGSAAVANVMTFGANRPPVAAPRASFLPLPVKLLQRAQRRSDVSLSNCPAGNLVIL